MGGRLCQSNENIESAFIQYYDDFFTAGIEIDLEPCLNAMVCKVSSKMNSKLTARLTVEEIHTALNQMAPMNAPGPNGYSVCFYQHNWATVHTEVCSAIFHFFRTGMLDSNLNKTHIALIPKSQQPECVSEFRPISLCNVLYKLTSKVLANRLKLVLPDIISCTQSAFIPGRLITDNILAAFETLHSMQTRMWSKTSFTGFKLDMSKAYDRVEWPFLEAVMRKLGIAEQWIILIMACVWSISYSILINGGPVGNIQPSRGIRKRYLISPYLFLICAEALSALLQQAERKGIITGVPTSLRGPRLSHIFFVNDNIIFCKANSVEWRRIMKIFGIYEKGSGQKLNLLKTSLFFNSNTSQERKQEVLSLSGLMETHRIDTYLGLPSFVSKSKIQSFRFNKDRVLKKINNWKVKFLSQADKEVLLKAVIQAIPTYSMCVFQLPITFM